MACSKLSDTKRCESREVSDHVYKRGGTKESFMQGVKFGHGLRKMSGFFILRD